MMADLGTKPLSAQQLRYLKEALGMKIRQDEVERHDCVEVRRRSLQSECGAVQAGDPVLLISKGKGRF